MKQQIVIPAHWALTGNDRRGAHELSERARLTEPFVQEMLKKLWIVRLEPKIDVGMIVVPISSLEASYQRVFIGQSFAFRDPRGNVELGRSMGMYLYAKLRDHWFSGPYVASGHEVR
jgi:hypothetical protein